MDSLCDIKDSNISDSEATLCREPTWGYSSLAVHILGYCLIILPLVTLVVNITAMVVIFRAPKLKLCTRLFLFSMTICYTLVATFIMPFRILGLIGETSLADDVAFCNVGNSLDVMLHLSSIIHLCLLTFDRYAALCKPFRHGLWFKRQHCVVMSVLSWLIPASLAFGFVPVQLHTKGVLLQFKCILRITGSCQFLSNVPYALVFTTFCYALPCIFIFICNHFILIAIDKRKKLFLRLLQIHTERGSLNRRHVGTKLAYTMMKMTSCFVACWLPYFVVQSVHPLTSFKVPQYVWIAANWTGYANSLINPVLYLRSVSFLRFRCLNET